MSRVHYTEMGEGQPRDQWEHMQRLKKADIVVGDNVQSSLTEVL